LAISQIIKVNYINIYMPVRHFDEIGKLYSEGVKPTTDKALLSEQKVGNLPADAFPQSNKGAATDKAFNAAGPEAAENFEVSPNDTNKKKSKKSAYNEEGLSQPVVQEKSDDKEQKLLKGSKKTDKKGKVVAKEAMGMDTLRGAARGGVSGAKTGAKIGAVGGGVGGAALGGAVGGWKGALIGGALGAGGGAAAGGLAGSNVGAGVGAVKGLTGMRDAEGLHAGNTGAERDTQRAQRKLAGLKASAKPGKRHNKSKIGEKNESSEINNSTMRENNKSTFDRLFEDVMGEDFEEFGADADGMADIEVGGDEGGEDLDDTVTLELPRDLAEGLHAVLMDQLGGGEDDVEDLGDAEDLGDLGDEGDLDEEGHHESHAKLDTVADATGKLGGKNNKVALSTDGGSAHHGAGGQEDGGKPKPAHDGVAGLQATNNKVGNVQGGNAFSK
jgi:hypothetical protein